MKKDNGFSFIEVLVAFSIVFVLIMTFLPIISLLQHEETILSDRRHIANELHDELQSVIWKSSDNVPSSDEKMIRSRRVTFEFTKEKQDKQHYIKGCGTWKNVKGRPEEVCLYGIKEK